jgi:hypothetical protein
MADALHPLPIHVWGPLDEEHIQVLGPGEGREVEKQTVTHIITEMMVTLEENSTYVRTS